MKTIFALLVLAGLSFGQSAFTISGQTSWGDTLRWGHTVDSTSYLLARGNAIYRDSASTWFAITTDSCSKPSRIERGAQKPGWMYLLQYEVRTSSGNTDSSQVDFKIDTRYCGDPRLSINCDAWIPQGRHDGYLDVSVRDSIFSFPTTAGVTWKGTQQYFFPGGGSQLRACVDGHQAGGQSGDSTFFRRVIVRYQ